MSKFDKNWIEHLTIALEFFKRIWDGIKSAFDFVVSIILPALGTFLESLVTKISEFTEPIVGAFSGIWDMVKEATATAFEAVKNIVVSAVNWVLEKVQSVLNAINRVAAAGASIAGIKNAPSIPDLPKLATGGIVTQPTVALIGEAGPEAVVPLSRAGGAGFGGVTVNINGGSFMGTDSRDVARRLGDMIIKELQMSHRIG